MFYNKKIVHITNLLWKQKVFIHNKKQWDLQKEVGAKNIKVVRTNEEIWEI
jgi:hypothetical protein